jgi:L-asparaginase II
MVNDVVCEVRRGGRVESIHRGSIVLLEGERPIYSRGDFARRVFLRSCAKPFQCWGVVESGAAGAFGLSDPEIAVMSGSHLGEPEHVKAVQSILRKSGATSDALRCGVHPPSSPRGLRELYRSRREPTALHNNCSGKHAGMIAEAIHRGAPVATYLSPSHPVQRTNLRTIARLSGEPPGRIALAVDGCSAPTFGLPLVSMARAMARFLAEDGSARRVREAMMAHPKMVGRPCAQIMSAAPGKLLGKVGAEGLYLLGVIPRGLAVGLKIDDGSTRPIVPLLAALLRRFRLLGTRELGALEKLADPVLRNHAGREVGELRVFL